MRAENAINFRDIVNRYSIPFDEFNLQQHQFFRASKIHGIMHTYRVMVHVLNLGVLTGFEAEAKTAFFAAYIHDMARRHDGYCTRHGAEAAASYLKIYQQLFERNGATINDLQHIAFAVSHHSTIDTPLPDGVSKKILHLLKDADALDRIRLGEEDLNVSYLRFKVTPGCITFANRLYYHTNQLDSASFQQILNISNQVYI